MGYFKNIQLNNFRNFNEFQLEFSDKCNVLFGKNGYGKTNLLEALSLCIKGRGIRNDKITNFIKKDENSFSNIAYFVNENIEYEIKVISELSNNKLQKKILLYNEFSSDVNKKIQSLIRIFIASPTTRRNFFDHFILSNNNKYSTLVNFYKKNVYERNVILNNINSDENWLTKIEENISNSGIEIYKNRKMQVDLFVKNLGDIS